MKLGIAELSAIECGIGEPLGTPKRGECDRILKLHGYIRSLGLNTSTELEALIISDGLAPGADTEERMACENLLRRNGYVKYSSKERSPGNGSKPGPKSPEDRNSSRYAFEENLRAIRLMLRLDRSYTKDRIIALLVLILEEFNTKCDEGVLFSHDDIHSIARCVPELPRKSKRRVTKTYRKLFPAPLTVRELEEQLSLVPLFNKPKCTDLYKLCGDEKSLFTCFVAATDFDIFELVNQFVPTPGVAACNPLDALRKALALTGASKPQLIKSACRELIRIMEHFQGTRFLTKGWCFSVQWVFSGMDAEMFRCKRPTALVCDYNLILDGALCRQFNKPRNDDIVENWYRQWFARFTLFDSEGGVTLRPGTETFD